MSTNYGFEPTLDGLNNIDADNTTISDIVCNTIVINTSGTAPTMPANDNSTHIATTAYVDSATTGVFVTIGTTQTITGQKTFDNAITNITGLLNANNAIVLNSGSMYSPLGIDLVVSAPGLTDDLILIGGNSIALLGTTNISGTTTITGAAVITGQASAGSIMTNTYNPFLATADVNINPTQTSGSLNLGTKIDRSGIIQIGNGVNATCDIRIGTARTTGGTVSMGSNSSIANTLNLQSALINVGTGSPVGTANTINIGNGNTGSLIALKNDTTVAGTTTFNGKVTVDAVEFAIKSAGADKLTFNYALGQTNIKIKVDGDVIRYTGSDDTLIMELSDTLAPLYKKGSVTIPDTTNFNLIPAGTILTTVTSTVPTGYLYCDGTSYSSSSGAANPYYELFQAIAYTFGGSGATFKVPNFKGAFLRGASTQTVGGIAYTAAAVGTAQQDAVLTPLYASNEGFFNTTSGSATRHCVSRDRITADPTDTNTGILPRFDREATENRPFNFAVYYYIRY